MPGESPDSVKSSGGDHGATHSPTCPNCGSHVFDNYCAECGQYSGSLHVPLRAFIAELLSGFFSFDSRGWRTLIVLISRPGLLTLDFLQGKRARYVAPLRLYLFISFVTFFLLTFAQRQATFETTVAEADSTSVVEPASEQAAPGVHTGSGDGDTAVSVDESETNASTAADSTEDQAATGFHFESGGGSLRISEDELGGRIGEVLQPLIDNPQRAVAYFMRRLPWVYFFLLPVFAAVLQFLYRRREAYYVPHIIFTLHVYSAGFLLFSLGVAANLAFGVEFGSGISMLAVLGYVFLALRRVYQQSRLVTLLKQICLILVHGIGVGIGMVALFVYTVLTF